MFAFEIAQLHKIERRTFEHAKILAKIFFSFLLLFMSNKNTNSVMFNKYSYQLISAVNHADFALLSIRFKHTKIRLLNS